MAPARLDSGHAMFRPEHLEVSRRRCPEKSHPHGLGHLPHVAGWYWRAASASVGGKHSIVRIQMAPACFGARMNYVTPVVLQYR